MKVVIISGLSGAGKTRAADWFEDQGYYCIDNMPPQLIRNFLELSLQSRNSIEKAAFVADVRGGEFFDSVQRKTARSTAPACRTEQQDGEQRQTQNGQRLVGPGREEPEIQRLCLAHRPFPAQLMTMPVPVRQAGAGLHFGIRVDLLPGARFFHLGDGNGLVAAGSGFQPC